MSNREARFQAVLARLYTDDAFRGAFLNDPLGVANAEDLDPADQAALAEIDRVGLDLAVASYARKREAKARVPVESPRSSWARLAAWLRRWHSRRQGSGEQR